ncbi:MAG: nucleoside triphosphate pyrophosphohydrolase [Acidobacteria bacterium]|nr:MAG: nucleoside triphosphate pyrophosphohydrolase [Acidobacteriota bacterium]
MAHLRGPDGCPWDRVQDYDSVKGLLLEEAYEVIDAANARDFSALEEELGDLLFQVVFYSRLAEEENRFTIGDVVEGVYAKLVRRHPHVFGAKRARTPEEALASWLSVKEQEKDKEGKAANRADSILGGIAAALPATLEAYELGLRAAEVGFDWSRAEDVLDKVEEEVRELREELARASTGKGPKVEEEIGDLLFTVAQLARRAGTDPESALRRANAKFKARFEKPEAAAAGRGKSVRECSAVELDALWCEVKGREG